MKRLLTLALTFLSLLFFTSLTFAQTNPLTSKVIVLDPGHGGSDYGSIECPGLPEKDATLQIAFKLKELLQNDGAVVYLTRETDATLSNEDRYTFANSHNGNALISIHLNGSTNHDKNGTLGLYGKLNKDKAFTQTVHTRLASELGVPDLGVTNFASGVLLKSDMPATIQETVFISNTQECQLLTDGTGIRQQQIAQSLYNGLFDWFSQPPPPRKGRH
ncbi:N-acetylmuramoyl-L-alanine amidase [Candidatus Daviesbacteria bacterium]|nr:N-acetylmuramoyl-L-alanine amidase [Candidatus Daviesbacteria bacterium]